MKSFFNLHNGKNLVPTSQKILTICITTIIYVHLSTEMVAFYFEEDCVKYRIY